jgi:hypothetical protein
MNRDSEGISDSNINQTHSPLAQQQGAVGGSTGGVRVEVFQLSELLRLEELQVRKELDGSMIRRYADILSGLVSRKVGHVEAFIYSVLLTIFDLTHIFGP